MVALDFPSSPSNGQVFGQYVYDGTKAVWRLNPEAPNSNLDNLNDVTITTPLDEQALIYNTATGNWINAAVAGGVEVSATAPAAPSAGDLWWNSTIGDLFVYYNDGDSSQWVPASGPKVTVQSTAPTGYEGQLWLDDTDGSMYVYYTDPGGGSSSWIGAVSRSGGILQVVSTTKTDSFSTPSTSYVDVTGLSVTITPSSTSSKILIMADYMTGHSSTGGSTILSQLVRGGSQIGGNIASNQSNDSARDTNFIGINYLDSPASTSTLTYQIQVRVTSNIGYVGRTGDDSTSMLSHITVMEVAG
jgi:hypothetical protein